MPRLFVAVWPPDEVLDELAALPRPEIDGLRWTTREQWHVTLRFLGPVPAATAVVDALAGLDLPHAQAALGPAIDRFGRRILYVPVAGLEELAEGVIRVTSQLGQPAEDRPFTGHLTLARVAKGATVDLRSLSGTSLDIPWVVREFCLVESNASAGGRQYDSIATFALQNPGTTTDASFTGPSKSVRAKNQGRTS